MKENFEATENEIVKERHGCVSAWLIFMIIANSIMGLIYIILPESLAKAFTSPIPTYLFAILGLIGLSNVIFSYALLKFKLWGFYGFIASSLATFVLNVLIGIDTTQSILGLSGIAVLYGVLQIKKNNISAWNYLE